MDNKIKILGLRDRKEVKSMHTSRIENAKTLMDGFWLDELQITTTLTSPNDFDELIELLQIHKYCFHKLQNNDTK